MEERKPQMDLAMKIAYVLGFILVLMGMVNAMPAFPGLDAAAQEMFGNEFKIRKFDYQYFFPLCFALMMIIAALSNSFARAFRDASPARYRFGLFMDVALITAAVAISLGYLVEIRSVCLIDQFTGERAELIAKALQDEKAFALSMGLPEPNSVDDPECLRDLGGWIFPLVVISLVIFLGYTVRVWGASLVAVAVIVVAYTVATILIWYFHGADDISKYLVTKLGGEPRSLMDARPQLQDILVSNGQGLLGRFMAILMTSIFPYLVLGALFGASAGGQSLIKLSFLVTRRMRGGPAHAAIISSAMFGTVSGGPIVNVLSTGVLTIPMMIKRGFGKNFAGGIEAAASSGGQIMPPVMGVAAFILAAMTVVPYNQVIVAASLPALAYFGCLFLTVVFQARKQNIQPMGTADDTMRLTRDDKIHLLMILLPVLLILVLLLTPKSAIGCGPISGLLGIERVTTEFGCRAENLPWLLQLIQNSVGDAGSAGWWATVLLVVLFFLDRKIRQNPGVIVAALAEAGLLVGRLYLMFLTVSVIDFCLNLTGLSNYLAVDIVNLLRDMGGTLADNALFLMIALLATMLMAVVLGMGMPTVPAYINVALLMGPMLVGLGISTFTANLFIFYFAVASAITPPVALAAFAAASITRGDPIMTGFAAVKAGIVMFIIPFVFAFYPELLLIEAAQLNPLPGGGRYLPGLDGEIHPPTLLWIGARVALGLYLIASVLARYDKARIGRTEGVVRTVLAVLVMIKSVAICGPAIVVAMLVIGWHWRRAARPAVATV